MLNNQNKNQNNFGFNNQNPNKKERGALGKIGHGLRVAFIPNFKRIFFTRANTETFDQIKDNFEKLFNARQPNNNGITFKEACKKHSIDEDMIYKSKRNTFILFYFYNLLFFLDLLYSLTQAMHGNYFYVLPCIGFNAIMLSVMLRETIVFHQFKDRYVYSFWEFVKHCKPYIPVM